MTKKWTDMCILPGVSAGRMVYHCPHLNPDQETAVEINPVLNRIKDLQARSEALRGYL